jgi:hypothetical protein
MKQKTDFLINTFTGGMVKDIPLERIPNDHYTEAWNAVAQNDENFVFTNEHGNALAADFGGEVVGYMRVPDRDITLFFVKSAASEIYQFDHKTKSKKLIVSDAKYGCNWNFDECEVIFGEYKTMQPCNELVIYFSSNCIYYTVNIDEVQDAKRAANLTCEDFLLMRCVCAPTMVGAVVEKAGADLLAGAYQFATRVVDKDGNESNWFLVGEPVYLGSEDNIAGQRSTDGINLFLSDLDPRYTRVDVAVVRTIGGATTVHLVSSRSYNTDAVTVTYTSTEQHLEDISLDEILIKKKTYLKGRRLFQKDGRLFLYQIQQEKNLNYQRKANEIGVKYIVQRLPATDAWRYKGLMRDEVYALGIVWKYCDGTYSPVFHIPNNVSKPSGNAESCTECDVPIWLKESTAQRTETYCALTQPPLEEYCYCPPNAECDENCNVIIGDPPVDDEDPDPDQCVRLWLSPSGLDQFPPCMDMIVDWSLNIDGQFVSGSDGLTFSDSDVLVLDQPYTQGYDSLIVNVRPDFNCPNLNVNFFIESVPCVGGLIQPSMQLGGPKEYDNNNCPNGDCFSCSNGRCGWGCSGGGCSSGGCSGGGCSGGRGGSAEEAGHEGFTNDIRPNVVHQQAYQKALCQDAGEFITDNDDIVHCAECASAPATADGPKIFKAGRNFLEQMRDLMRKDDEVRSAPSLNTTSTLAEAAANMCGTIDGVQRQKQKKAELEFDKVVVPNIGANISGIDIGITDPDDPNAGDDSPDTGISDPAVRDVGAEGCLPSPIYGPDGCTIVGYKAAVVGKGTLGYWESQEVYPLDLDCDGIPIYGDLAGQPIRHHKMPSATTEPIFISRSVGVRNFMQPENDPMQDTDVFVLGLEFSNIQRPDNPPKPICGYEIVMAKRGMSDRSVIAKGMTTHTFRGKVYGEDYAFGKHGVNSFPTVDRYIENGTEQNHLGEAWNEQIFGFHSPDLNTFEPFLNPDSIKLDYEIYGTGWRHGLYANGGNSNNMGEPRLDRRGARSEVSLNRWHPVPADACIDAITYAPADSIVRKADGFKFGINHRYREKCVYFQTTTELPTFRQLTGMRDGYSDYSFIGDGVDHMQPVNLAIAHYGALKRLNKSQYGGIESLTYVLTGLRGSGAKVSGQIGDTSVSMYSFKRSSYVSNKVGDVLNEQFAGIAGGRITRSDYLGISPRTICMPPNTRGANLLEHTGMWDHTELPTTGDTHDPKNMASLHPTRRWNEVYLSRINEPESDVYYPRVQTTLIHFWCESEIEQKFRQSGSVDLREIFYGKLKGSETDSSLLSGGVAEQGWLNDFHQRQTRISKRQLAMRAAIRTFVTVALPTIFAGMVANTETGLELAGTLATAPLFYTIWLVLDRFLTSNRNLNRLLNIPECKTDEEGAEQDEDIRGFKDNYHRYNLDYSKLNDINLMLGMPPFYNTCDCGSCEQDKWTNEIYYSNRQIIDSQFDAYRNFNGNDYLNIPAHAGRLMNLFTMSNRFYAHTTDAIWVLQYANAAIPSDQGIIVLGSGGLLSDPQMIMEGIMEGYAGIQHPKSAINTRMGYFFVDEEANKFYQFNDGGLKELNAVNSGMYNFFRDKLSPCNETCKENKYKIGIDNEYNRILFSNGEMTMSYDYTRGKWISFHSYLPEFFVFDRFNMYTIKNGKIWIHDDSQYGNFYGEQHPFVVEFAANTNDKGGVFPFLYESTIFDFEANQSVNGQSVKNLPLTFDRIWLRNTHQSTGWMDTDLRYPNKHVDAYREITASPGTTVLHREYLNWKMNMVRDNIVDPMKPVYLTEGCSLSIVPNAENHDCSQSWDKTYKFVDKYLVYRIIFNNFAATEMNLRTVFTRAKDTETVTNG